MQCCITTTGVMPKTGDSVMLKLQLENLDGLDENLQSLYTEADGKFNLNVEGVPVDKTEDVTKLKSALDAERAISKQFKTENEKAKLAKASNDGDIDSVKKQMSEMHQTEIKGLQDELDSNKAEFRELKIDNVITAAIADGGGIAEVLKPFIANRVRLGENGTVEVLNDNNEVQVDKDGKNVTISSYVSALKEDSKFSGVFKGTTHSGGGTTQSDGGVTANSPKTSQELIKSGLAKR